MYRADKIKTSLFGGVGWRQTPTTLQTKYPVVNATNLTSESGLTFQAANHFVTIQNVYDSQQEVEISDADFNTYLEELQNEAILTVCDKVLSNESYDKQSANLYPYEKTFENTIDTGANFIGFKIEPRSSVDVAVKIPWIELMFDSAKTFNVYLINSNRPGTMIKTQSVTTVADESVIVDLSEWYIADDVAYKGGSFYIGYFESDLDGAKPIKRDYELSSVQVSVKDYYVSPVSLNETSGRIDVSNETAISDTNGLNIGFEVYTDYTELIIRKKNQFWRAIQLQLAENAMHLYEATNRTNKNERNEDSGLEQFAMQLYGNRNAGIEGVQGKLTRVIEDLNNSLFYKPMITRTTIR